MCVCTVILVKLALFACVGTIEIELRCCVASRNILIEFGKRNDDNDGNDGFILLRNKENLPFEQEMPRKKKDTNTKF